MEDPPPDKRHHPPCNSKVFLRSWDNGLPVGPATSSLDRAASSQVSPGMSCHKRACSPPGHHQCQPRHRPQHLHSFKKCYQAM